MKKFLTFLLKDYIILLGIGGYEKPLEYLVPRVLKRGIKIWKVEY